MFECPPTHPQSPPPLHPLLSQACKHSPTHPPIPPPYNPPSPNNRMDEAVYHFSFPCEFHGERFSHGPREASELASNPRENRNRKVRCVADVKTLQKSPRTALRKKKIPLRLNQTRSRPLPFRNSGAHSPVCQRAPPSSIEWLGSAHLRPQVPSELHPHHDGPPLAGRLSSD